MKLLALVFALCVGAPALADPAKPTALLPDVVEEVDLLRAQLAQARVALAERALQDARAAAEQAIAAVRAKHKLTEADSVDMQTRKITRSKPSPKR
jgi:Xaa-Pro aminopeptidase